MPHHTKKYKVILAAIKLLLAVGILVFLFLRISSHSGFERLISDPKDWGALILAQLLILVGFSLSFVRWFLLVRGLELGFHLRDAFRLGSLGFMFNQVSPGSVGGDLLKAVFIAKEQPGKRTEAVTTVLIDRAIGLYAMILVASLGLMLVGSVTTLSEVMQTLQTVVWSIAAISTVGVFGAMSPLAVGDRVRKLADRVPVMGHTLHRLLDATEVYHRRKRYLVGAFCLALVTHNLVISAFWLISHGLPVYSPSFSENASVVPIGLVLGTLPLTPGGLGTLEAGLEYLFVLVGAGKGDGTLIALVYRMMTYVVAAIGAGYYLSARKSVDRMLHDAEEFAEEIE
ncbi:MAG: flippase-like domain-containing protein [Planctomycetes bacterium]|nr:flippase-like domain-containing protein [Planctomycetota bacterium]